MQTYQSIMLFMMLFFRSGINYCQSMTNTARTDSSKFATVYIYRLNIRESRNNTFRINFGDTSFKVKNNTKHKILVYKEGTLKLWSNNETRTDTVLEIKFKEEYFIRCELNPGMVAMHPKLVISNTYFGKSDCDNIPD